jgi:hypothetical protein
VEEVAVEVAVDISPVLKLDVTKVPADALPVVKRGEGKTPSTEKVASDKNKGLNAMVDSILNFKEAGQRSANERFKAASTAVIKARKIAALKARPGDGHAHTRTKPSNSTHTDKRKRQNLNTKTELNVLGSAFYTTPLRLQRQAHDVFQMPVHMDVT